MRVLLGDKLINWAHQRIADVVIGGDANPYMLRWYFLRRRHWFNVYVHKFLRSDDDRALHDHPWWNVSILLRGQYTEHTIDAGGIHRKRVFQAGAVRFRFATVAHRVELTHGPCWSLFITGPKIREWGFHCPAGWRHWREYTKPDRPGEVGRGCE